MTRRLGIALALLAAWLCLAPAAFAAEQKVTFGADPAPGSTLENGYYSLHLSPGATARQTLHLTNTSASPAELHLAGVDTSTGQKGSVAYGADDSTPAREGSWLHLDKTVVQLPARGAADVAFEVRVPNEARPGVHLAGIVVFAPRTETTQTAASSGQAGAVVIVESRRAIAVQVTLPGPSDAKLVISGVTTEARPNGLNLIIAIANQGFGLTTGIGRIIITGPAKFTSTFPIDTFLPDTAINYPVPWADNAPASGAYHASVVIDYGNQHASSDTDFSVGEPERAALKNRVTEPQGNTSIVHVSQKSFPIGLAVAIGLAGGGVIFWLIPMLIRRRRRPDTTASP